MFRILIVEDDNIISGAMKKHLEKWGHEVECVTDFSRVLAHFGRFDPQLVLMDIGLPFYNGYYWCAEIRKLSQVPIIFISSAGDNMNIVMAVNMGGDDFLVKPFDLEVLSAKVQAMLRRAYSFHRQSSLLEFKNVVLSLADLSLVFEGSSLKLSGNEFKILQLLFENAGDVVSRERIMKRLWDDECFVDDNTLTVNMNRLRRKLEEAGLKDFILTRKGAGYQLNG